MSTVVGSWKMAITDGFGPGDRLSLLNLTSGHARVELTFCAEGGQPLGPFRLVIPAQRALSPALADLAGADAPPPGPPYSVVVVSDVPLLVRSHPAGREAPGRRPAA